MEAAASAAALAIEPELMEESVLVELALSMLAVELMVELEAIRSRQARHRVWEHGRSFGVCSLASYWPMQVGHVRKLSVKSSAFMLIVSTSVELIQALLYLF